jgi:cytidylate kinase
MTISSFLPRQAHALQQLFGYQTEHERPNVEPARTVVDRFTVALSREAGTPAAEVAGALSERLGWPVYDQELPACIARELHLPVSAVEEIDERGQSWLVECMEAFSARPELSQGRYFLGLVAVVRSLGEQGRSILVGRGAAHILPPRSTLRVLLVGDREDRITTFSRCFHLDRGAAARQVEEINRSRSRFIREHFQTDPTKARHYDLVLNTSQWSPADCADFIVQALHHKATGHLKG